MNNLKSSEWLWLGALVLLGLWISLGLPRKPLPPEDIAGNMIYVLLLGLFFIGTDKWRPAPSPRDYEHTPGRWGRAQRWYFVNLLCTWLGVLAAATRKPDFAFWHVGLLLLPTILVSGLYGKLWEHLRSRKDAINQIEVSKPAIFWVIAYNIALWTLLPAADIKLHLNLPVEKLIVIGAALPFILYMIFSQIRTLVRLGRGGGRLQVQ